MPTKADTKQAALDYVNSRIMLDKVFSQIKRMDFISSLAANIKHPSNINQGKTNFCGPASVLHALAKYHPMEYATFALDLFQKGTAMARGAVVDATFLKDEAIPPNMNISACDWVTMAGLRNNLSAFSCLKSLTTVTTMFQGTYPFELKTAFEMFGYTDVRSDTSFMTVGEANFRAASDLVAKRFRVILSVHEDMFHKPTEKSWMHKGPNHFCTLKSTATIGANIKCRLWQWGIVGGKKTLPEDADVGNYVDLPKDQFFENYFGYIAAGEYKQT